MTRTVVHLVRHGKVENPTGIIYGRLADYHLSEVGRAMAEAVAAALAGADVGYLATSPLDRAQETAAPIGRARGLTPVIDPRLIEPRTCFEGQKWGFGQSGLLRRRENWRHLGNPFRPSWGEPYQAIAHRMLEAVTAARTTARGREAICVSHQLAIWTLRRLVTGQRLWHDPRRRECGLASITSLCYADDELESVTYAEPARSIVDADHRMSPTWLRRG